jgi:hypothetical protein
VESDSMENDEGEEEFDLKEVGNVIPEEELEKVFGSACGKLPSITDQLSQEDTLKFYGLYKQALEGDCNNKDKPSIFNPKASKKWY